MVYSMLDLVLGVGEKAPCVKMFGHAVETGILLYRVDGTGLGGCPRLDGEGPCSEPGESW